VVGSSAEEETRVLERQSALADAVIRLGPLSEAEKEWLLRRATLVLYPSVHEGFGLVPFEAASHGVPCLWARGTSLSEILPDEAAGIVPWDPVASADAALALMREEPAREANLAAIRSAARALRWEQTAAQLLEVYLNACERPPSPAGLRERTGGLMQRGLSEDAMRLVGPDGLLPRELERPLLALASHRRLGTPVFRAIKAGYEASARRRRRRR
jgi:hypothetical protein